MTLSNSQREMYEQFQGQFPFCFACGIIKIKKSWCLDPVYPRWFEVAHILGGASRIADRRNIVKLCKLCHDLSHGHTIRNKQREPFPKLTLPNILWIKQRQDPEHYDIKYLNSIAIRIMPEPEEPDPWFQSQFEHWQPELYRKQFVEQFNGIKQMEAER